jgi:UDP-glucose 4-epimerase
VLLKIKLSLLLNFPSHGIFKKRGKVNILFSYPQAFTKLFLSKQKIGEAFFLRSPFAIFVTMKIGAVRHSQAINVISVCLYTHLSLSLQFIIKNLNTLTTMKGKILVTGGTGYIGSHSTVELQNAGYEVVIIDNLSNSNIEVLDGIERITGKRPTFVQADCTDMEALRQLFKENPGIKGIIHFAASKAVGESVQKPLLYYRNNLMSLVNLLTLMPEYGVEGIVFSSSCTVYGQPDVLPVDESAPIKPALSPYGNTKQICEEIIKDTIHANAPFKSIILRYFNPIGAHPTAEIGELPNGVPQNLIPYLTQTAIGIRKELSVFGDDYHTPDGSCIRDYINVVDLAKAHVTAMNRMLENKSPEAIEIFNLGTGRGVSVLELISAFEKATGVKVPHKIVGRREGDIEQVWANPERANKVLGWTAQESIEDTLASAWKWQLKLRERGIM